MSTLKSKVKQLLEKADFINVKVRSAESERNTYIVTFESKKGKDIRLFILTKKAGRYIFFLGKDGSFKVDRLRDGVEFAISPIMCSNPGEEIKLSEFENYKTLSNTSYDPPSGLDFL